MKRLYALFVLLCLFSNLSFSQTCLPNGITITTQATVDLFSNNYVGCTKILGNLEIESTSEVTTLSGLSQLEVIEGDLKIYNCDNLVNLDGLNNIDTIKGDLIIENNNLITNLSGLENIKFIGGNLEIRNNPLFNHVNGVENLDTIGGYFVLDGNADIIDLDGLDNLEYIGDNFFIQRLYSFQGADKLNYIGGDFGSPYLINTGFQGLDSLETIGGNFLINNLAITDFVGLNNLTSIGGSFELTTYWSSISFTALENLKSIGNDFYVESTGSSGFAGLDSLQSIGGSFTTNSHMITNFSGLENLDSIGNSFEVQSNTVTDFSGLEKLSFIGEDLDVKNCHDLEKLSGLNQLSIVGGHVYFLNNSSLKSISGLNSLDSVNDYFRIADNDSLTVISGFENLSVLNSELYIAENKSLDTISGFQNLEKISDYLIIRENNELSVISGFCQLLEIEGYVRISKNPKLESLIGFKNLNKVGLYFFVYESNRLKDLSGLEGLQTIGSEINISDHDSLTNIEGLKNLQSVGYLNISFNPMLEDLDGLEKLTTVETSVIVQANDSLNNLFGLSALTNIDGKIFIRGNESLTSLEGIENINPSGITELDISSNPSLVICDQVNICNYLNNGGVAITSFNAPECGTQIQIEQSCADNLSYIETRVFYDMNQNKIKDVDEPFLPGFQINIEPFGYPFYSDANGFIPLLVDVGDYLIHYDTTQSPLWNLTTDSVSYSISVDMLNSYDTLLFGFYPNEFISDVIPLVNGAPARCGEFINFEVHSKNLGTTIPDGIIWLEIDEKIDSIDFINIPDTIGGLNMVGWNFDSLIPGNIFSPSINLKIPIPPDVMIGDSIYLNTFIEYQDANGMGISDTFDYQTEIRCSFDPNDKLVNPSRNNNFTLFEEDLIYTIRFQNTGNDAAYDIIIRDTLDENLDPTTFRVLSTSHPSSLITSMEADQFLTFNFENIYLPDSTTNFDASQGYVSYLIAPKEGLAEETLIENTASIYFDFNPPIVTNTTQSVMVSELPTSIHNLGGNEGMKIEIFPNPVSDNIFIKKEKPETLEYQITDVNGRLLMSGELIDEIHNITFTKINSGIYFIKIINPATREYIVEKIVK